MYSKHFTCLALSYWFYHCEQLMLAFSSKLQRAASLAVDQCKQYSNSIFHDLGTGFAHLSVCRVFGTQSRVHIAQARGEEQKHGRFKSNETTKSQLLAFYYFWFCLVMKTREK